MSTDEILGIDIHDAIMGLKRAIENDRLKINSLLTIRALEKVSLARYDALTPPLWAGGSCFWRVPTLALIQMIGPRGKRLH